MSNTLKIVTIHGIVLDTDKEKYSLAKDGCFSCVADIYQSLDDYRTRRNNHAFKHQYVVLQNDAVSFTFKNSAPCVTQQ